MVTLPACATSAELTATVQEFAESQVVNRGVPAIRSVEPGPGFDGTKPLPVTRNVNPSAAPAYRLAGRSVRMFGPPEMITLATPSCELSAWLTANTCRLLGVGAIRGAV